MQIFIDSKMDQKLVVNKSNGEPIYFLTVNYFND